MNSFHSELNFVASAAGTPWGDATNLVVEAACARLVDPGHQPFFASEMVGDGVATPWARGRKVSCLTTFSHSSNSNLNTDIRFNATRFNATLNSTGSNWYGAARFSWNGSVTLASSNFVPLLIAGKLLAMESQSPWGSAHDLSLECRAERTNDLASPETSWGLWSSIAPWTLDWHTEMRNMASPKLSFDHLDFSGHWHAPQVVINNFQGDLYGGHVTAGATLDIDSRELHCKGVTDFNPHSITNLFNPAARDWMAQLDWMTPPKVNAHLRVVLPPWTNRPAQWSTDMASSLQLAGDFTVGPSSFRGVLFRSGAANVTYTNRTWNVSHLHAVRPDGDIVMDYNCNEVTQDYRYLIDSHLDPKDALPLFGPQQQHILDDFIFKQSPHIHGEIWGCLRSPGSTGFTATVQATNFIARRETVAAFNAGVDYTNLILDVHHLSLSNDQCQVQAPWIQANFSTKLVRLTNVTGTLDPAILQRVLRDNPPDFLNHIHFDKPPSASVSGSFSLTNAQAVDLHFFVSGQRLHYASLLADRATGKVDWTGPTVSLTNISASLYNGMVAGWLVFNSPPKHGSDFHADFNAKDIDLSSLAAGIIGKTNHVEGRLDGRITLGGPNSQDTSQWQGQGSVYVHDALLWDIKLFGLLSPVLNAISPGLGHSRAREATADFVITNGVTSSDNLEMRCPGFRLELRGTVDRNKQINARFEADLSRDAPVVGSLLSTMFTPLSKMFEYHISGSLHDPVMEPVYVPKFIMLLLHPFHTIKTITAPAPAPDNTK